MYEYVSPVSEKISENEALLVNPALSRQHKVLTGSGRGLLAKGLQDFDLAGIQGSKAEKKLLQYSGLSKLNLVEVCLTVNVFHCLTCFSSLNYLEKQFGYKCF